MKPYIALTTVISGEVQGGTTKAQLPNVPCTMVNIRALSSNATSVYLGGENVKVPDGTTDQVSGFELDAGQETGWLPISNLNQLWMITDANGDDICYLAFR
jgi:hypothetical protein